MTRLKEKFLEQYSIDSLRDVELAALIDQNMLVYDNASTKWKNVVQPRFGKDANQITKTATETTTGNSFTTYSTLNFTVTGPDTLNTFRLNADFLWGHNSASNDARFRALLDGVEVDVPIMIEPKDTGSDQRIQNNILYYATDLSIGAHTFALQYRPATSSRVTSLHRSVIEVWRTK